MTAVARAAAYRREVKRSAHKAGENWRTSPRSTVSPPLRRAVYAVGILLWVSGTLWLVLHHAFPQRSTFGPLPNPWEAPLMRLHGLIAVCGVFLIGWLSAAHIAARLPQERNRRSGVALGSIAFLLIFSGYALYYTTGGMHDAAGVLHEVFGVLSPAVALLHWWRNRSSRTHAA